MNENRKFPYAAAVVKLYIVYSDDYKKQKRVVYPIYLHTRNANTEKIFHHYFHLPI